MICCIRKSGKIEKRLFEFKIANHFLKDCDGDSALEVLSCILIMWLNAEKSDIESFDYEKIDAELARLDEEIKWKQLKDVAVEKMRCRICAVVTPLLENVMKQQYAEAVEEATRKVSNVMQQFKNAGDVVDFNVTMNRNTMKTVSAGEFHVDVMFKLHDEDKFSNVAIDVVSDSNNHMKANAQ